ncbi:MULTISPECIES: helix-turn-helix transcriptional regulator [Caproicibacterium]|uniref:Helix-turn-helix transcriptional regulator n=1 Tax=Caproicibacterium argilliputei TaxID=3030016 RepID=A0AA97DBK1_9FIRM|nr:helix-turn-helix transcriptional regulator [Caproicibacterium argilliputei]WOC33429.1 helix-turn-helix transcriptional regulator [Caproicibacterium argilliputei]
MFEKLRKIRTNRNVSGEQMAEVLGLKTQAAYYKKEAGTVKFSLADAKCISEFFHMPIEEIFFANELS